MNIKVVIVWGFAIVVLAFLGVFGYFNQGLLESEENKPYEPIPVKESKVYTCRATMDTKESIYTFTIRDNELKLIGITYNSKSLDPEGYEAANNVANEITSLKLNGLTSNGLQGGISDYSLKIQFNPKEYDKTRVEELTNNFSRLLMVIDSIDNYETYKIALNNTGIPYTCE